MAQLFTCIVCIAGWLEDVCRYFGNIIWLQCYFHCCQSIRTAISATAYALAEKHLWYHSVSFSLLSVYEDSICFCISFSRKILVPVFSVHCCQCKRTAICTFAINLSREILVCGDSIKLKRKFYCCFYKGNKFAIAICFSKIGFFAAGSQKQ